MANVIETALDIPFENPRSGAPPEDVETLLNSVRRGSTPTEPVGIGIPRGFRERIESQQIKSLHCSVPHRRDAKRPSFAVRFRNIHPPQRLRMIASPFETLGGVVLLLRCRPDDSVHTRGLLALVFRHPFNGDYSAAPRAGQQALQGSHLVPPAVLRRLHDTRLKTTHGSLRLVPVYGIPADFLVWSCTNPCGCHLLCLLTSFIQILS